MGKTISEKDVKYVASLSRIELGEEEVKCFGEQISDILGYIDQLNEVDTGEVPPTTHVLSSMKNVFREDRVRKSIIPDKALCNAPERKGDFFAVPKIIKGSGR